MADVHGLGSCVRHPLAVRLGAWPRGPLDYSLALPSRARTHLLFCMFLAAVSDPWAHRSQRNSPGRRISACGGALVGPHALLVCANVALVFRRLADANSSVLGGHGGISTGSVQCVAARNAPDLSRVLSFVRERRPGFFWISIRRHAARSWIHCTFFGSGRISPGLGHTTGAFARQSVPAAMGGVSDLLRLRRRQAREPRPRAPAHDSHGRAVPKPAAG